MSEDLTLLEVWARLSLELLVFGILFYFIEKIRRAQPEVKYFKKEFNIEFFYMMINILLIAPIYWAVFTLLMTYILTPLIPYQIFATQIEAWPFILKVFVAVLILDFTTYWRHRITHKYLWNFHAIHHSAQEMSWLTRNKFHPLDLGVAILVNVAVLHIIGFEGVWIVMAGYILKSVDYFCHANLNFEFRGPLRYLISTPNYHRWHHANHKESYDKNFCAVFPFLDVIFGTYHFPENRLPEKYGLTTGQQKEFPSTYSGQFVYPFAAMKKSKKPE